MQQKAHFVTLTLLINSACTPQECPEGTHLHTSSKKIYQECLPNGTSSTGVENSSSTGNNIPTGDIVTSTSEENTTETNSSTTGQSIICGNGIIEADEYCDNGENNKEYSEAEPNDCTIDCKYSYCGDNILNKNEECDNGGTNLYGCHECVQCGNGLIGGNEICDDGPELQLDGCWACKPMFYVFVTSETFQGNFGSLDIADAICQNAIKNSDNDESLKKMIFKAWLSDSINSPETRFSENIKKHNGDIRKIYGNITDVLITQNGWNGLINENLLAPIDRDENGNKLIKGFAWTGSTSDNINGDYCGTENVDWMSNGKLNFGSIGSTQKVDNQWKSYVSDNLSEFSCENKYHFYCFSQ